MSSDDFWEQRERAIKSRLIMHIIDYCDTYDIIHNNETFDADSVRAELMDIIDIAITAFIKDN